MGLFRKEESDTREEITLVDFLYKDSNLINSFYSQIFGGDIESIVKNEVATDEATNNIKLGIPATVGLNNQIKTSMNMGVSQSINPHDHKVIKLIESFNLKHSNISEHSTGTLLAIKGTLIFRNYDSINKLIPFMGENNLFPDFNSPIDPNNKGKKALTFGKLVTQLLNMMPYGLEFEVHTTNNENAICILKDEYLTIATNDLLRSYGVNIPGEWTIIGIADSPVTIPRKSFNNFKSSIDDATVAFTTKVLGEQTNIIRPIAIYRKLNLSE